MSEEIDDQKGTTVYEAGYNLVSSLSPENLASEVGVIKSILEKHGALTVSEEFPKLRALAFMMRKDVGGKYEKYNNAYFGWVKFEVAPTEAGAIEKELSKLSSMLRLLVVKTVRESTMSVPRVPSFRRTATKPVPAGKDAPITPETEDAINKDVDALIASAV